MYPAIELTSSSILYDTHQALAHDDDAFSPSSSERGSQVCSGQLKGVQWSHDLLSMLIEDNSAPLSPTIGMSAEEPAIESLPPALHALQLQASDAEQLAAVSEKEGEHAWGMKVDAGSLALDSSSVLQQQSDPIEGNCPTHICQILTTGL